MSAKKQKTKKFHRFKKINPTSIDHMNEVFFDWKYERAKEILAKYPIPEDFLPTIKRNETGGG